MLEHHPSHLGPPLGGHRVLFAATATATAATRPQGIDNLSVGQAGQNPVQTPEVRQVIDPVPGKNTRRAGRHEMDTTRVV